MRQLTFAQATLEAMAEEMNKDDKVFVMGEDIARQGGIFGQFKGLGQQFPGRVIDTPISETFICGGGVGAALAGARPVVDMHFIDFIGVCMDEVLNQMAKARYMLPQRQQLYPLQRQWQKPAAQKIFTATAFAPHIRKRLL